MGTGVWQFGKVSHYKCGMQGGSGFQGGALRWRAVGRRVWEVWKRMLCKAVLTMAGRCSRCPFIAI